MWRIRGQEGETQSSVVVWQVCALCNMLSGFVVNKGSKRCCGFGERADIYCIVVCYLAHHLVLPEFSNVVACLIMLLCTFRYGSNSVQSPAIIISMLVLHGLPMLKDSK